MNMFMTVAVFLIGSILGMYVAKNVKTEGMSGKGILDLALSVAVSILANTGGRDEVMGAVRVLCDRLAGKGHVSDVIVNIVSWAIPKLVAVSCCKERGTVSFRETQQYRELLEECVKKYEERCYDTSFKGGN